MGGLGMNLASWRAWGRHVYFLEGFSPAVWVSVVCASLFGLMCALMLRYLDNAVRCFSGVAQMLGTVVASRLLPRRLHEDSVDLFFVASLALLSAALILYQAHKSERLSILVLGAVSVSLSVGLWC